MLNEGDDNFSAQASPQYQYSAQPEHLIRRVVSDTTRRQKSQRRPFCSGSKAVINESTVRIVVPAGKDAVEHADAKEKELEDGKEKELANGSSAWQQSPFDDRRTLGSWTVKQAEKGDLAQGYRYLL